jgi:hypothetical protein
VVATRRNVSFGMGGYAADERAPEDIALVFRGLLRLARIKELARLEWERRDDPPSWEDYRRALSAWDRRYNQLLHVMHQHKYKSYLCYGYRLRLEIESDGCRRHSLAIEEIAP